MKVQRSAILPHSAAKIFSIIRDVRSYPEFLNWCDAASIEFENNEIQRATLSVSYGKLTLSFSTQNALVINESVRISLISGPFKSLSGEWSIHSLSDQACKVSLFMDFKFDNPITHKLFGNVFQKVVTAQIDAFEKRANDIYHI